VKPAKGNPIFIDSGKMMIKWKCQRQYRGLTVLLLLLSLFSAAESAYAQSTLLKMATAYPADNFQTQNIMQFSDEVKRMTNGRVDIEVHPAGELLRPTAIYDGVRTGAIAQAGEVIMSSLSSEHVVFGLDTLPFFVNDYDDAQRLWKLSRPQVEKALDERGLVLLYAVPWPPQNLYASHPINTPQDFKGLRMRDYNAASERIAQIVGATPVKIEALDLPDAIADKKVDLMLTSSWTGSDAKAWTSLKYYYKVNAWIPKNVVFINKSVFSKFSPQLQQKILSAAQLAEQRGWQLCRSKDSEYEALLLAHNMQINPLATYVRNFLDRAGEKMAHEYLKLAVEQDTSAMTQILADYTLTRKK